MAFLKYSWRRSKGELSLHLDRRVDHRSRSVITVGLNILLIVCMYVKHLHNNAASTGGGCEMKKMVVSKN